MENPDTKLKRKPLALPRATVFLVMVGAGAMAYADNEAAPPVSKAPAEVRDADAKSPALPKQVKLPGLVINLEERCVDVESSICLREGALELIACTKDSKEHESIVVIAAKPSHIHAALLLLGAQPGNPAMRRAIDDQATRWIDMPPQGDPVDVFLVFKNPAGEMVQHPIGDFIARSEDESGLPPGDAKPGEIKFPDHFVFAGSQLHSEGTGPRRYLSDLSGNVISIATFGDELLCLSGVHDQSNGALMWRINSTNLPEVGSNVTLRLRPRGKAGNPASPSPDSSAPTGK